MIDIKTIQNKHKDKTCFVVASGPSLHFQDLYFLKDHITIAVNAGIAKIPFANYFLSDDHDVQNWSYWRDVLPNIGSILLLYQDKPWRPFSKELLDRTIWFKHKTWHDTVVNRYHKDGLVLTKESEKPIIGARNSAASAVHFAYIMGCKTIILLGCDCCFVDNKKYFWQFDGEAKVQRLKSRDTVPFNPKSLIKYKGKMIDPCFFEFIKYWKALAEQCERQNIKVYDGSDGVLDVFEKIDIKKFGE